MHINFRRAAAAAMALSLSVTAMTGCSKKAAEDTTDSTNTSPMISVGDLSLNQGTANLILRYEQAQFESGWGSFIRSYYGGLWDLDLTGSGSEYGDTFKSQVAEIMEEMLLCKEHMADFDVELTDDEETQIAEAAQEFMDSNDEATLNAMSATLDNVKEMLELFTIRAKMEVAMTADVDTEVSDEEAAQRTVSYVSFTASTEAETEETEGLTGDAEGPEEALTEETPAETESVTEAAVQPETVVETSAAVSETEVKTQSSDETEEPAESVDVEAAEAGTESMTETETEDPAMVEAKAVALAKAQAFLDSVKDADDFDTAADEYIADESHAYHSSWTFGSDDTYPDAAVISATEGLEDGTLVDHVVQVDDTFYVLYVTDAFDEDATADKKDEIVEDRKEEAIEAYYDQWTEDETITVDNEALAAYSFNTLVYVETEAETEDIILETEEMILETETDMDAVSAESETGEQILQ